MRVKISELRRIVFEAVAAAKEKSDRNGGLMADPALDLSRPPPGGGVAKRQGRTSSSPFLNSESRVQGIVRQAVREALRGGRR